MKPTLLVLAAGMGSRYGGLKQVDPIGPSGETLMEYGIFDAQRAGFDQVVFLIRDHMEDDFRKQFGHLNSYIKVSYAHQDMSPMIELPEKAVRPNRDKPWGTGHAVLSAAPQIGQAPFAVINADDFYGVNSYAQLADFLAQEPDQELPAFSMVGYHLVNTLSPFGSVSRGVCQTSTEGYLESVVERTNITKQNNGIYFQENHDQTQLKEDTVVSMNCWGFTPEVFPYLEASFKRHVSQNLDNPKSEYYIPLLVNELIESGRAKVRVMESKDQWFGVTYQEDRPHVQSSIQKLVDQGVYPKKLWS